MDKKRTEDQEIKFKERHRKDIDWNFQMVNDYPLSDKTLVVSPQTIPLSPDELPEMQIEGI